MLQHQFWDLIVTDFYFEVGLSFNGISERLHVPLEAIKGFFDPSVQFGLQFEIAAELDAAPKEIADNPAEAAKPGKPKRRPVEVEPEAPAAIGPATPAKLAPAKSESAKPDKSDKTEKEPAKPALVAKDKDEPEPDKPSGGAEVVRLDRFRKK